ncbi:MAG: acyl-CoA thioesterase domain-containing protein [Pseudomonadota bacterium]
MTDQATDTGFDALTYSADGTAQLSLAGPMTEEMLAAYLARMVRTSAAQAASAEVAPVSVTVDMLGAPPERGTVQFSSDIDRKTRTIVFANGDARTDDGPLMTATAVFRIL